MIISTIFHFLIVPPYMLRYLIFYSAGIKRLYCLILSDIISYGIWELQ